MAALSREQLERVSASTLGHYDARAKDFWEGTRTHDVSQNVTALLEAIDADSPYQILDVGCGPGRDLMTFKQLGHIPVGLDGSAELLALAKQNSGCEIMQQDFLSLDLPRERFDGVFANASLFHVPAQVLPDTLRQLHATLKPGGAFFSSNPRGHGEEGFTDARYGAYHDLDTWRRYMTAAGFVELSHYYRPPGLPRDEQRWLASVWRKPKIVA